MHNLLTILTLWLVRKLAINVIDQTRLHAGPDAVARGQRWETFYREQGGLADMLIALRQEAFEAAQEAGANDDQTRLAWMLQDRAYRKLSNRIEAVVSSGSVAAANIVSLDRMQSARIMR